MDMNIELVAKYWVGHRSHFVVGIIRHPPIIYVDAIFGTIQPY